MPPTTPTPTQRRRRRTRQLRGGYSYDRSANLINGTLVEGLTGLGNILINLKKPLPATGNVDADKIINNLAQSNPYTKAAVVAANLVMGIQAFVSQYAADHAADDTKNQEAAKEMAATRDLIRISVQKEIADRLSLLAVFIQYANKNPNWIDNCQFLSTFTSVRQYGGLLNIATPGRFIQSSKVLGDQLFGNAFTDGDTIVSANPLPALQPAAISSKLCPNMDKRELAVAWGYDNSALQNGTGHLYAELLYALDLQLKRPIDDFFRYGRGEFFNIIKAQLFIQMTQAVDTPVDVNHPPTPLSLEGSGSRMRRKTASLTLNPSIPIQLEQAIQKHPLAAEEHLRQQLHRLSDARAIEIGQRTIHQPIDIASFNYFLHERK